MDTFHVNIYIETSSRGPAVRKAAGEWIVEFVTSKEVPVTRSGIIYHEKTTEYALALELIKDALSILTKPCSVIVNTTCTSILNATQNHWVSQWRKNDWTRAQGKPVSNKELWQQVSELMDNHYVEFDSGQHSYRNVMQKDIQKELIKDK